MMEQIEIMPGEWISLSLPSNLNSHVFWGNLGRVPVKGDDVFEFSKDGKDWIEKVDSQWGNVTRIGLRPNEKWIYVRYRNASDKPRKIKIEKFSFEISGASSPIDDILSVLNSAALSPE